MRKIERDMIAAIRANCTDKRLGNTRVHAIVGGHEVQLHGNTIARVDANGAVGFTLAGWPTPTTRSRINALLREFANRPGFYCGVGQRRGAQYYSTWTGDSRPGSSREIGAREWVQA